MIRKTEAKQLIMVRKKTQPKDNPQSKGGKGGGQNRNRRRHSQSRRGPSSDTKKTPSVKSGSGKQGVWRVIPVGGNEEVGRNMTIFEYENDIVIVDMGLQWPEEDMPGIDYIIPNTEYLKGKEKNIRGVIITHGHYDHIGAIPHIIPKIGNPPIYGTPLTLGIIKNRQEDFKTVPLNLKAVDKQTKLQLGKFKIGFIGVSHNIPDSVGVLLETPLGRIIHTGDFKLDPKASADAPAEIDKIKRLGKEGVLAFMADSTNAQSPGRQLSEGDIKHNIEEIIADAPGRLIFGTFASLLSRIQQIIWSAEKFNKKVNIQGYSMKRNVELAQQLGYLRYKKGTLITDKQLGDYDNKQIVVIATGAQGEDNAQLMRIANSEHRVIKVERNDTIVFSSSVIPGNERAVQRLKDRLYRLNAEVIHYQMMDVHAGGHAKQDDLAEAIDMVKPKYHIPVYGNHHFLKIHAKIARQVGIPEQNIFVVDNGQVIEFHRQGKAVVGEITKERVPTDYVFVDGLGVGDVSNVVIRDRRMMADDGMLVVIATISGRSGRLMASPDIISRGFIYMKENKKIVEQIRTKTKQIVNDSTSDTQANDAYIKNRLRDELGQLIYQKTRRRPMILPVMVEV